MGVAGATKAARQPAATLHGASAIIVAAVTAAAGLAGAAPARRFAGRQRAHLLTMRANAEQESVSEEHDAGDAPDGANSMEPSEQTIETMRKFSNQYARVTNTRFCTDKSVAAVVIVGLAHHKETLGAPLCPCRHYEDKEREARNGYWNCPCVPMRERRECHCMLFLTEDNPFAGNCQNIDLDEILRLKNT